MVVPWDKKDQGHPQEVLRFHIFAMATEKPLQLRYVVNPIVKGNHHTKNELNMKISDVPAT